MSQFPSTPSEPFHVQITDAFCPFLISDNLVTVLLAVIRVTESLQWQVVTFLIQLPKRIFTLLHQGFLVLGSVADINGYSVQAASRKGYNPPGCITETTEIKGSDVQQ